MSLLAPLHLLHETHAHPTGLDLLFLSPWPGELAIAMAGPGSGLSLLQGLVLGTPFTEGNWVPTKPEVMLRPDTIYHMWLQCPCNRHLARQGSTEGSLNLPDLGQA